MAGVSVGGSVSVGGGGLCSVQWLQRKVRTIDDCTHSWNDESNRINGIILFKNNYTTVQYLTII